MGFAIYQAQAGFRHRDAKPLKGFGSGVLEVVARHDGDTFRACIRSGSRRRFMSFMPSRRRPNKAPPPQNRNSTWSGAVCGWPSSITGTRGG